MSSKDNKIIRIALAGQPNVGKSVIFNNLTGMNQIVGNWPGKTIQKAEGFVNFKGYRFHIIDLPGIYSLSTYSLEEIVSREYILYENPDYIINVIDSNHLERNLYLSLQLFLLKKPIIISLNQYDILEERGYSIDADKLEKLLNVKVIKTIAVHNRGVHELLEKIIELEESGEKIEPMQLQFGKEIESEISKIIIDVKREEISFKEPLRFFAQKVLEGDEFCEDIVEERYKDIDKDPNLFKEKIKEYAKCLEETHGHSISEVFNAEYYNKTAQIVNQVLKIEKTPKKDKINIFFDHITVHSDI